ncbi:MAG: TonB-dependent receptor [Bacteroidaceae bacterium]|nr:TonB-dependent receptor [Bacteroidaceae bacterium]
MGIGMATAQVSKVTGKVYSEADGEPVIGASVLVEGTSLGASTDIEGNFTIENVPASATTLRISYVGMTTQEVHIVRGKAMKIILVEDSKVLDDVVVMAYGTAKKSAFTGSAAVVKSEEIGKIQTSNAANALTGKMAGVQLTNASGQPGATSPTIRIRGISSINAGNAPLIILDGAPYDGDLNNINSQDIESMTVLKDAASNALYGARGANGVIMITTKKGSTGSAKVTFDAKWGSNSRATQDYDYIKNPAQYYEVYYGALKNYYINVKGETAQNAHALANTKMLGSDGYGLAYNVFTVPEGEYLIGVNGKLNPNATLGHRFTYNGQEFLLTPDDYMDEAYNKSTRQEYNLNITAGNDKSSFYASVNYLDNEGITANSNYERLAGRLKADYKVKKWLKVGANMSYTHFESNSLGEDGSSGSSGNIFAYATRIAPIYPLYIRDGEGNIIKDANGFKMYDYGDAKTSIMGLSRPFLPGGNPYSSNQLDINNAEGNAFTANGNAEIKFLKDFKFTFASGVNVDETRSTSTTNPYYGSYASSNGIVYKYHTRAISWNHQQLLNWEPTFGNHNLNVMLGHEYYRSKYYYLYASKSQQLDPTNTELVGAITDNGGNSYTTDYNTEGFFGRVMYDYDGKYHASVSFRRDASSRFHKDNRWGNFWSAGAAWVISKEDFFDVEWVDMLKIKASYGEQGNDQIGNYRYTTLYEVVNSGGSPAAVPYSLGNKDITWETQGNFNAGVDFDLFKGRISGTIEFFNRKTTDMLFSFPLPPSYGYTSYYANIGDMTNRGIELELRATPIKTKDFEWNVSANFTTYENEVSYLPKERKTALVDGKRGFTSGSYFYGEGCSLYTFHMKKYAGINEKGESMWYKNITKPVKDAEGNQMKDEYGIPMVEILGVETTTKYNEASDYLCGTALPDAYGGFGTSLAWKGFDLSVDFSFQIGGQVYDSDYASMMGSPTSTSKGSNIHADMLNAWTESNNSNIPRMQFDDQYTAGTSDRFLTDASYLSLNNINFGYTFPKLLTKKVGIENLRVYVAADNIWVWSKRQGLDPRQSISGSSTGAYYAPIRTISGGVTFTF